MKKYFSKNKYSKFKKQIFFIILIISFLSFSNITYSEEVLNEQNDSEVVVLENNETQTQESPLTEENNGAQNYSNELVNTVAQNTVQENIQTIEIVTEASVLLDSSILKEEINDNNNSWNTPAESPYVPSKNLPKIKARPEEKNIIIDPNSSHSCYVENFSVDLKNKTEVQNKIILSDSQNTNKRLEILNLPIGYSVEFLDGKKEKRVNQEKEVSFYIKKDTNAQKGNFNITILFSKDSSSTSVCQLNIINK